MFLDTRNEPEFTQPIRQIVTMLLVVVIVAAIGYLLFPTVSPIFLVSPYLNGFILGVFIIGVFASFWQVRALFSAAGWIEGCG